MPSGPSPINGAEKEKQRSEIGHQQIGQKNRAPVLVATGIALAVAIGIGRSFIGGGGDHLSQQDIDRMNASWAKAVQEKVLLPDVQPSELSAALASTDLPGPQRAELEAAVKRGDAQLVWITLWDDMSEDGDVAALESEGLRITVPLLNKKTRVAIPKPAGGVVNLIGLKDGGGGGVTVGVMSGNQEVLVSPMIEGQVIGIPVR
jgi:hypothetical protein